MDGTSRTHGRIEKYYIQYSIRKLSGEEITSRPGCRSENNLRIYLKGIEWEVVDLIYLAQEIGRAHV
jgi:hypothetical protein